MTAASGRAVRAHARIAQSMENVAATGRRMGEQLPLRAMDQWSKHSDDAGKNLATLGRVGVKSAAVGLAGLAGAMVYAVKTAGDFEKQMRNVNSIAKLSEPEFHRTSQAVLQLAGQTAQAPKVLAEGLYQLVSSGFNARDSLTILGASAKAATAGLTDTATATTAVAAVLNAYRLPASEASHVSDVLFETVNRGVLTFEELTKSLGDVLPFASSLGVPLNEVGAAIATMTKEGVSAPETMTRIKREMQSFIKPSKDMTAAIRETGASSAETLVKQRGLQGAIEAVVKTTDGSKQSIAKLFPDIRALGGVLALTGHNAKSAQQDLQAFQDTTGATDKVFKEQSKSAEFAGKRLGAAFQTAAIIVGNTALPILAKGAEKFTSVLQRMSADGSLQSIGTGIIHIFGTLGQAIGNLIGPLKSVASALIEVGSAVGLGNADELSALAAAFLAFKGVQFVAPILLSIGAAIAEVGVAAATAPSIAAFAADIYAMTGPVGLAAAGLAILAGAFVAIKSGLFDSASAAQRNAQALREDKQAIEDLNQATTDAARSELDAKQAALDHKNALNQLRKDEKLNREGKASDLQLEQDRLNVLRTGLRDQETISARKKALNEEVKKSEQSEVKLSKRPGEIQDEITQVQGVIDRLKKAGATRDELQAPTKKLTALEREYNSVLQQQAQLAAQVATAEISRKRLAHGEEPISAKNAQGVSNLQILLSGLPKKISTRFELEDQGTLAKLGTLGQKLAELGQGTTVVKVLTTAPNAAAALQALKAVAAGVPESKVIRILHNAPSARAAIIALRAVIAGVPASKVIHILTTAPSAQSAVEQLRGAIASLQDRTVTITTITRKINEIGTRVLKGLGGHAAGRQAGTTEAAVVGEGAGPEYVIDRSTGQGARVDQPTLMGLGPDDYVIPMERRYRGRALGLFVDLARDMDIPGYKAGKKPPPKKRKHRPVPPSIDPLSLPLTDLEQKRDSIKTAYDKAHSQAKSLTSTVATDTRNLRYAKGAAKKKDAQKLREDKTKLARTRQEEGKRKAELAAAQKAVREAKAYQAKIDHETSLANIAANDMKTADNRDDEAGYQSAKKRRVTALGVLRGLIEQARKHVRVDSKYFDELSEQVGSKQVEAEATEAEERRDPAAEREEQTGMTDQEAAELRGIEKDVALAALTDTLADDQAAAARLVGFLERVLGEAEAEPGPRGGDASIKQLAEQLKTARQNLASFSGGGTNENADLQAQINQANQRREVAEAEAKTANQALEVFGGAGDIGAGAANAYGAAKGQTINVYTLHPGDPNTLRAIGDAATSGIDLQGSRQTPRIQVGP